MTGGQASIGCLLFFFAFKEKIVKQWQADGFREGGVVLCQWVQIQQSISAQTVAMAGLSRLRMSPRVGKWTRSGTSSVLFHNAMKLRMALTTGTFGHAANAARKALWKDEGKASPNNESSNLSKRR